MAKPREFKAGTLGQDVTGAAVTAGAVVITLPLGHKRGRQYNNPGQIGVIVSRTPRGTWKFMWLDQQAMSSPIPALVQWPYGKEREKYSTGLHSAGVLITDDMNIVGHPHIQEYVEYAEEVLSNRQKR